MCDGGDDMYEEDWMDRELQGILNDIQKLEVAGVDVEHLYAKYWPLYEDKARETDKNGWVWIPAMIIGIACAVYGMFIILIVCVGIAMAVSVFSDNHMQKKLAGRLNSLRKMTDKTLNLYYSGQIKGRV